MVSLQNNHYVHTFMQHLPHVFATSVLSVLCLDMASCVVDFVAAILTKFHNKNNTKLSIQDPLKQVRNDTLKMDISTTQVLQCITYCVYEVRVLY